MTLNDISITPSDGQLAMDATAKTYRYLDEKELAEQKKRGKGQGRPARRSEKMKRLLLASLAVLLAACGGEEFQDLRGFRQEFRRRHARQGGASARDQAL